MAQPHERFYLIIKGRRVASLFYSESQKRPGVMTGEGISVLFRMAKRI